jgi:hypothetical protein
LICIKYTTKKTVGSLNPYWKAVRSVQTLLKEIQKTAPLTVLFDFHAPHPITKSFSHYYLGLPDSSLKTENLKLFMRIHQQKEGYTMVSQRNNRIKAGEQNFNRYILDCAIKNGSYFPNLEFSTTYEQSWQEKPDGTPYTSEEISKSGGNLVKSLAEYFGYK